MITRPTPAGTPAAVPDAVLRVMLIVLLTAAVVPLFVNLGGASIWDANEAFYVETPIEMIERGDYINPTFNYEPRFNKPVLSYWIVAGLYHVLGVSVAVERLAIALAAVVILVAAWFIARAASPQPLAPLLAVAGLAAGPRFFMFSRRILIDVAVTAMMTLTVMFFVLAERYPHRRKLFLLLMYASVGLGVLTKGPVAAVIPLLVFTLYLAVHREIGRLRDMMIPTGVAIALLIAAPWYVALYLQHGWSYITAFFIGENIGRFTETVGVQARGPFFYVPVLLGDSLPWSLCLPAAFLAWRRDRARRNDHPDISLRLRTLLLLWVGVMVALFSLSRTKQDLYIFPVIAAVAALGGDWIARAFSAAGEGDAARDGRWLRGTMLALGGLMVLLGAAVLFGFAAEGAVYRIAGARIVAAVSIAGGLAVLVLLSRRRYRAAVPVVLAVFIAFNWILAIRALPSFERYKPVVPLADVIARHAGPQDVVAHYDLALPSMVFYLRRHIDIWFDAEAFANQIRSDRRVFAVLPADRYDAMKGQFGVETCVVGRHPTADIRLRTLLEKRPPPEVLVVTNRCPPAP